MATEQQQQQQPEQSTAATFRLFRPPQNTNHNEKDLPESYFTPSTADLKAAQASLAARVTALQNAPFRTQAMREADNKSRRAKYPNTTIRIRFNDRSQLEKTFPSTDKIRSVYAFVRGSLRENVKPIKFVLYQTPPKRELKVSDPDVKNLDLFELQLSPSSTVVELTSLSDLTISDLLDDSVLAHAEDFPIPPTPVEDVVPTESSSGRASGNSSTLHTLGSGGSSQQVKVPKWLKLGSKQLSLLPPADAQLKFQLQRSRGI
ncbi:hypothetical protein C8Q75DRAFT_895919 [Abortiporus biennis]|nr:hypothetical protein C8Q75DRAFT_895919 [Abortiporus biennis]